jgi:hypothetical protein
MGAPCGGAYFEFGVGAYREAIVTFDFVNTAPAVGIPNIVEASQNLQTVLLGVNYRFW